MECSEFSFYNIDNKNKRGVILKKIDVHIHSSMWENARIQPGCILASPEEIKESYRELDIDKGFLLPLISPEYRFCVQTNEEMEYLATKYSDTFYWFCNIDPRMGFNRPDYDLSEMLMYYKQKGAIGVGEVTASLEFDDPLVENLFYHCAECDLPVTIHIGHQKYDCYGILDDLHLPKLEKMLKKYPKLKILGHSACFWSEIDGNVTNETRYAYPTGKVEEGAIVRLMRKYPNLYCDCSAGSGFNAITRDEDFGYKFIEEFSDRLMYGTDICQPHQKTYLASWLDNAFEKSCISYENYYKFCRGNAIRIFNLNLDK